MEALAFAHAAVAYEDPNPAPELQVNLEVPSSAWVGALSTAVVLSAVVGAAPNAEASVRFGDVCPAVSDLQATLINAGYNPGGVDSTFGSNTLSAVQRFQSNNGLNADGVVGPQTANAMGLRGAAFRSGNSCSGYPGETPGSNEGIFVSTNGSPLTVRSGPGGGYAARDYLTNGTLVTVTRTSGGWSEIEGGGWVSSDWLGSGGIGGPDGDEPGGSGFLTVSTNGSELVVRSGPGIGYSAVAYLANGSSVPYRDYSGGWYQITDGGWVSSSWVN